MARRYGGPISRAKPRMPPVFWGARDPSAVIRTRRGCLGGPPTAPSASPLRRGERPGRELGARADPELRVRLREVELDRADGHDERLGDLLVREPLARRAPRRAARRASARRPAGGARRRARAPSAPRRPSPASRARRTPRQRAQRLPRRSPLPVPTLGAAEREQRPGRARRETEAPYSRRRLELLRRRLVVRRARRDERGQRRAVASPQGCSCASASAPRGARRPRPRLLELAELDERLDEVRRDREGARVVHALALRVLPDPRAGSRPPAPARARGARAIPSARSASSRSQRDPVCLARAIASSAQRTASPASPRPAARSARQRSYIGQRSSALFGGLRPLVEEALGRVPAAGPQLELADVQALQRVRRRLAALVRHVEEPRQRLARASWISPRQTSR